MKEQFKQRLEYLQQNYRTVLQQPNTKLEQDSGVFFRYEHPVLTAKHIPLFWRYDLNYNSNPFLMERFGVNAVFNAGAIRLNNKYLLMARVEGTDRKSFFAIAESESGTSGFQFWDHPVQMPETGEPDINIYDIRLVQHEDGWIYGLFCTERRDPTAPETDQSAAVAQCGIARTHDLKTWERLPDLKTKSPQQRNVVLHPEFVDNKYAFYTRPQDGFIDAGNGGGIAFGLAASIENAVIETEVLVDKKRYHTISELKNGLGPAPIKTAYGWLHLAHGVRSTAAGLRYTLYLFMTDLHDLTRIIHKPGGYFMAPEGEERIGDVSNVLFSNGWIVDEDGRVLVYYAASDTRMYVAESSLDRLLDYVMNTPEDGYRSALSVFTLNEIIYGNIKSGNAAGRESAAASGSLYNNGL